MWRRAGRRALGPWWPWWTRRRTGPHGSLQAREDADRTPGPHQGATVQNKRYLHRAAEADAVADAGPVRIARRRPREVRADAQRDRHAGPRRSQLRSEAEV